MHVKPEHHSGKDLDDDDDLDDEDDDERKPNNMLGHHPHHHHHHMLPQSMSRQHPAAHMQYMKDQMVKSQSGPDCGIPLPPSKPKIWSLADTAACKTPPPIPTQQPSTWCTSATPATTNPTYSLNNVRNGFISPGPGGYPSRYGYYGSGSGPVGCPPGGPTSGFPDVQTDTPPQTPPNMKLPSVAGNLMNGSAGAPFSASNPHMSPPMANGYPPSSQVTQQQHQIPPQHYVNNCYAQLPNSPRKDKSKVNAAGYQQSPAPQYLNHSMPNNVAQPTNEETAFKPFYKK